MAAARDAAPVAVATGLPASLQGVIWYVDEGLVRLAPSSRTGVALDDGEVLYPSRWQTTDSQLVAIGSRGDGSPTAEQLVLVRADGQLTRVGPRAAMIRDPAVVPGGVVVAATLDGHSDLYLVELARSDRFVRITDNPQGNFAPAAMGATPDIVFVSSRDGDSEIYRMPYRGGAVRRLTAFHKDDWQPTVAPDGEKLVAFLSDREGPVRVFVMAGDGTYQQRLTDRHDDADETEPVWDPLGRSIAYLCGGHLWLASLDERRAGRDLTPDGATDADPSFSPDGRWIVVARTAGTDTDLWAIPTAPGAEPVRITSGGGVERLPRWMR